MAPDLQSGPDSPPTDELRAAEASLGVLQHIVHPLSRDDLTKPTASGDFDVAQLTDHLVETITSIGEALDASDGMLKRISEGAAIPTFFVQPLSH